MIIAFLFFIFSTALKCSKLILGKYMTSTINTLSAEINITIPRSNHAAA